jgi:hypothetical protein
LSDDCGVRVRLLQAGLGVLFVASVFLLGALSRPASGAAVFAPTPTSPVYGGIPGALPPRFHYLYNDSYRGWPINPTHAEHPVRGSFLDPRGKDDTGLSGYHFGIDISVDDRQPEVGAAPLFSHRVYAEESGIAHVNSKLVARQKCVNRRLDVAHFSYWHVSPTVANGQHVKAGQQIGWSCKGVWHVHLSEWQLFRGKRVWVNPLHYGSKLTPYTDIIAPTVNALLFVTQPATPWHPTVNLAAPDSSVVLPADHLRGLVELRANISDQESFLGFLADNPAWPTPFTPYRVTVTVRNARSGQVIINRTSFQADQLPQTPYIVHYAPGTIEDDNMAECVGPPALSKCAGTFWFRPFSRFHQEYWDTRATPNGPYWVTVHAYDLAVASETTGDVGTRSILAQVKN